MKIEYPLPWSKSTDYTFFFFQIKLGYEVIYILSYRKSYVTRYLCTSIACWLGNLTFLWFWVQHVSVALWQGNLTFLWFLVQRINNSTPQKSDARKELEVWKLSHYDCR